MKIKGKHWMDWLHEVRRESQKQRRSSRHSLAKHLKVVEGKASSIRKGPSSTPRGLKASPGAK
jgi:hypothetical protein